MPWRRAWQPTPVFLPGEPPWTEEPGYRATVHRVANSPTRLKQLSMHAQWGKRRLSWRNGEESGLGSSVTEAVTGRKKPPQTGCCCCCLVGKSCLTLVTLWTIAHQAPLSVEFPHQEYWSGLPLHPPGDLPDPEMESMSPALADGFFTIKPQGKPTNRIQYTASSKLKPFPLSVST